MDLEKIAVLIKNKRKEKGLTQEELAKKLNVTEKAISRWETGRGMPDISLLLPLANVLGVTVSEILSGKEDKKSNENLKEIIEYVDASKSKKNIKFLVLSVIIYVFLLFFYLYYLKEVYSGVYGFPIDYYDTFKITCIFGFFVLVANGFMGVYYEKISDKEKLKKISFIILLVLYLIMIFNLTIFGRVGNAGIRYNLVPFKTILDYFIRFNQFDLKVIVINILGNIMVFMPLQYFLQRIGNFKKFKFVFLIDFLFIFCIELLQLITQTGIFDIDDILLNLFGMFLVYFGMSFLNKNKIEK